MRTEMISELPALKQVRVSYIIATKNRAIFLERALQNIREFIEPIDELIIIDGMSSDGTTMVVERNADIVATFVSEPDKSEAHAFNKGLFRARGRFIKMLTDDDYVFPDAMRAAVAALEKNPEIDVLLCGGEFWNASVDPITSAGYCFLPINMPLNAENVFKYLCSGLGLLCNRTALEKTGGIRSDYHCADLDFLQRIFECECVIRYLDLKLYRGYIYSHSGVNNQGLVSRDFARIDLRRGELLKALSSLPHAELRFVSNEHLDKCIREINVALHQASKTKLRIGIDVLAGLIRLARPMFRTGCIFYRRMCSHSAKTLVPDPGSMPNWSGLMR